MAKCWSCGSKVNENYVFVCPNCSVAHERLEEELRPRFSRFIGKIIDYGIAEAILGKEDIWPYIAADIASTIEWCFEKLSWEIDQMTGVLKSIDKTLKTPSMTQAKEWRQMAEELRERNVLDESEKFFLKSLEVNPLDYRTYIGLGKTYLQKGKLGKARAYWEESLPHAPEGEIDYKSYSYRLIGRAYFCEEDYHQAASILKTSIELSPNYYLGHYDYAQYCALIGDKENCLTSLKIAILKEPIPLELVEKEKNFDLFKDEIKGILRQIKSSKDLQKEIKFRSNLAKLGRDTIAKVWEVECWIEEAARIVSTLPRPGFWAGLRNDYDYYRYELNEARGDFSSLKEVVRDEGWWWVPETGEEDQKAELLKYAERAISHAMKAKQYAIEKQESLKRKRK